MSFLPGARLGPYEIVASIGSGGMGEVYRARDSRLGRDGKDYPFPPTPLAVKVLPTSFAGDAERRARFEREAQAVASLSHPNVMAIFDTGAHDGEMYLVMELLAGQTLRERLSGGSLTVRKAVDALCRSLAVSAPRTPRGSFIAISSRRIFSSSTTGR